MVAADLNPEVTAESPKSEDGASSSTSTSGVDVTDGAGTDSQGYCDGGSTQGDQGEPAVVGVTINSKLEVVNLAEFKE